MYRPKLERMKTRQSSTEIGDVMRMNNCRIKSMLTSMASPILFNIHDSTVEIGCQCPRNPRHQIHVDISWPFVEDKTDHGIHPCLSWIWVTTFYIPESLDFPFCLPWWWYNIYIYTVHINHSHLFSDSVFKWTSENCKPYGSFHKWGYPSNMVGFILENPIQQLDDLGVPLFQDTPISLGFFTMDFMGFSPRKQVLVGIAVSGLSTLAC